MNVKELIEKLQQFPPNLEVFAQNLNDDCIAIEDVKMFNSMLIRYPAVVLHIEGAIEPEEEG